MYFLCAYPMHVWVTITKEILSFAAEAKQFTELKQQNKTHQKMDLLGPSWPCIPIYFSFAQWKATEQKPQDPTSNIGCAVLCMCV